MRTLAVFGSIACLISLQALADCVEPKASASLPDGSTASREDMVSAMKILRDYDAATKEYAACLEKIGGNLTKQNAAVDRVEKLAARYNAELRAFKKRSGG
jgi:hypothetical protein